ncbi:E3 ubiquitin-protein ligase Topors-like isoform X2 [Daphnia pulicaria]|nr:E3 ubiquitin-protein ligase Topors-like isoform X2 [Daphnia pulicaria]
MASTTTVDNSKRKEKSPEESSCRKIPLLCFDKQDNESSTCVICLEIITNKSFANKCLHKFCFECLLKWSEQKAECPLCNGPFTAIIHKVKSDQEYDEHIIESIPSEDEISYLNSIVDFFDSNIISTSNSSTSNSSTSDLSTSDSSTSGSSTSDSNAGQGTAVIYKQCSVWLRTFCLSYLFFAFTHIFCSYLFVC